MQPFPVHTLETAPEKSRPSLQALQGAFGMIPNIAGAMSTSPVLINSLVGLFGNVHGGSFSEAQVQVLLLTNAVTNSCAWAVAFHSALALKEGVEPADVQAIRQRRAPRKPADAALSALARSLIEKRGLLDERDVSQFIKGGLRPGPAAGSDRRRRRFHHHQLHRQRHPSAAGGGLRGAGLERRVSGRPEARGSVRRAPGC